MTEAEKKLAAARTRLILDKPFLGALVLRLPLKESGGDWCTTSATDARSIYYHPDYINQLSLSQVQFVLAHEALHCGLSHFARREHRDIERWNIACDHAVNPLLLEDGLELPPGALYEEAYTGLSAEEIYPLIKQDTKEETLDQHLYDCPEGTEADQQSRADNGSNTLSTQKESNSDRSQQSDRTEHSDHRDNLDRNTAKRSKETGIERKLEQKIRPSSEHHQCGDPSNQRLTDSQLHPDRPSADEIPRSSGAYETETVDRCANTEDESNSGQGFYRRPPPLTTQESEQLNIQWQQRLVAAAQQASLAGKMNGSVARLIDRLLRSTVPWRTLLARYMSSTARVDYNYMRPSQRRSGEAILPSLHTRQANVVIALDTSGSIEQQELAVFVAEVNAIKSLVNTRITVLACDWQLDEYGPWVFEPWERISLPNSLQGGGGTDFSPVFDWIRDNMISTDLVIYFTDAQGRFPPTPYPGETLWLVKGSGEVPWGQRIQLN